jgi:hypothetical protein
MRRHSSFAIAVATLLPCILMSGCGQFTPEGAGITVAAPSAPATPHPVQLTGRVHGGQQPVSGAQVYLFAASTAGYGTASTSLLNTSASGVSTDSNGNGYVATDNNGNFNITGDYTCPAGGLVYALATGGNPGISSSTFNFSLSLMAALGPCSGLSSTTFISINEVTTVASVWALAPFIADIYDIGTSASNISGLTNAFAAVNELANIASGTVSGPALPAGAVLPAAEINTIANVLSACINSQGGIAGDGSVCGNLFTATTPASGILPYDTVAAALNMARNPAASVATLFNLAPAIPPFQPTLATAPNDWTLAVQYHPTGLSTPNALAIDASGDVWIANCGSANCATTGVGSVTELANSGALTGSTSAGGINVPYAIAIDLSGNAWIANYGGNSITELNQSLGPVAAAYTGGGLNQPNSIAIDNAGNAWLTNAGVAAISEFSSTGTELSGSGGIAVSGVTNPIAIAINPH